MTLLCGYLLVSIPLVLLAIDRGWLRRAWGVALFASVVIVAALTVSPGLGAIPLVAVLWYRWRPALPRLGSLLALAGAVVVAAGMLAAATVSPTASGDRGVTVPVVERRVEPSSRVLTWESALRSWTRHPLVGRGLGAPAADVTYLDASGRTQYHTDAHNTWLSIAAEKGLVGVAAFAALLLVAFRRRSVQPGSGWDPVRLSVRIAVAAGFGYQGLTASLEHTRHLWLLLGVLAASARLWPTAERAAPLGAERSASSQDLSA